MQAILNAYSDAFQRCYPTYSVSFQKVKAREGKAAYNVVLNGDKGNRPMTLDEIREATAALTR